MEKSKTGIIVTVQFKDPETGNLLPKKYPEWNALVNDGHGRIVNGDHFYGMDKRIGWQNRTWVEKVILTDINDNSEKEGFIPDSEFRVEWKICTEEEFDQICEELEFTEKIEELKKETEENSIKSVVLSDLESYDTREEKIGYLEDVCTHGGVSGMITDLIYYTDTGKFYDDHENEIWDLLEQQAEELGHDTPLEMIAHFNGADNVGNLAQFKNLLAWYSYEETAREVLTVDLEIEF